MHHRSAYHRLFVAALVLTLLSFSALSPAAFSAHPPLPAAEAAQRTSPGAAFEPSLNSQQLHHHPAHHPPLEEHHHHRHHRGVKVYWTTATSAPSTCVSAPRTGLCAGRRARRAHSFVVRQCAPCISRPQYSEARVRVVLEQE